MSYPLNLPEQDPRYVTPMGDDPREEVCEACLSGDCDKCDTTTTLDSGFPWVCRCWADHDHYTEDN